MKLILHIGMPKAGSSSLQKSLRTADEQLRRHGLLYPAGGDLPKNHNMLVCGFVDPARLPRLFKQAYGGDEGRVKHAFDGFMRALEATVRESRPDTLVLSGEMLFRRVRPKKAPVLKAALARLSDDIAVVAYVRSPAQYYMSLAQQALKASSRISLPRPVPYRQTLEFYARITEDIRVIAYERSRLHGADIARDFLHRLAPELAELLQVRKQANQTISAEGMDVLHRYRACNHAGADDVFTKDTDMVLRAIEALEEKVEPFRRPSLHDQVRDYVNGASVDLLWLRAQHGIVFADVDYDRISADLPPPAPPRTIADICAVDDARRDRLLMAIRDYLTGEPAEEAARAERDAWRDRTLVAIHDRLGGRFAKAIHFEAAATRAAP